MVDVEDLKNAISSPFSTSEVLSSITSSPAVLGIGAGVLGVGLGVTAAGVVTKIKKRKTSKRKTVRKKSSRNKSKRTMTRKKRKCRNKYARTAGKGKDTSKKRIRMTKHGQPYIILASGKARFIKKSSACRSRKMKGGRY